MQWGARRGRKDLNSVHQKPKRQTLLFFLACHVTRRLHVDRRLFAGITFRPSYLGIRTVKTPGVLEQKQRRLTIVQRREKGENIDYMGAGLHGDEQGGKNFILKRFGVVPNAKDT